MWLKDFLKSNLFFLLPFFAFVVVGGVLLNVHSKEVLLLAVNSRFSAFGDVFFRYYTHLGDGVTYLILGILMLVFVSKYKGLLMIACYALTSIPVQLIKRFAFEENYRPRAHFWFDSHKLHFPEGAEELVSHSFPSGHSATAFSMFLLFSFFLKDKMMSLLFFVMAVLVAYSRMYLAAHFFADVYGGSLISVCITLLVIYLFEKQFKLSEKEQLEKGLLNIR
jgi:membrane-associated phospholipid phosphatase